MANKNESVAAIYHKEDLDGGVVRSNRKRLL